MVSRVSEGGLNHGSKPLPQPDELYWWRYRVYLHLSDNTNSLVYEVRSLARNIHGATWKGRKMFLNSPQHSENVLEGSLRDYVNKLEPFNAAKRTTAPTTK